MTSHGDRVERFDGPELDESLWVPHFLPHLSTPDASAARYHFVDDGSVLRIDADQPRWLPHDATRADLTIVNLSILKNGRSRAIRFSTLTASCEALGCQPGDLMSVATDGAPSEDNASPTPAG